MTADTTGKDRLFAGESAAGGPFVFNEAVARVFPDMLRRSIPGYAASIEAIGALARRYASPGSRCYDLGCSLGAATLAMRHGIAAEDCRIIAVDSAAAMVARCREIVAVDDARVPVEVREADIRDLEIRDASMVVMNYTLQFLPVRDRDRTVRAIADGMRPGGVFVISEKVVDEDPELEALLVEMHLDFKRQNAYSELEISRKRAALDKVLVPETVAAHRARLKNAGFSRAAVWLRHFNFVSLVAIR
ncbi:MAG: carboxy-S-adenosyl-L-methionine synthase CmoA [Gammaproteobacteria bacterium]|nr:carboxy-S-adenosyl-L-methionine synthase CmoA [Gammaproteobacteria bacterium]